MEKKWGIFLLMTKNDDDYDIIPSKQAFAAER